MRADVDALSGSNVCTPEEKEKCLFEIGEGEEAEQILKWECSQCEKKEKGDISPYTYHLIGLRQLTKSGYPWKANDLPIDVWRDLGALTELIESKRLF